VIGKQLEMLKEVVPKVSGWPSSGIRPIPSIHSGCDTRRMRAGHWAYGCNPLEARDPGEIDNAFTEMTREQAGAVVILNDSMLSDNRIRIADHAARRRLPTVFGLHEHAEAGGFLAYEPSRCDRWRRAATYVDEILKGAQPGNLPVEQPTKFELIINLKTAKTLGLTIPPAVLARADEVIAHSVGMDTNLGLGPANHRS
jgi:putative ABC transport system substrate-binding protein